MESKMPDYDIIIAGGGLAGMIVASSAAYYSNQTLRILVIDRNLPPELGKKTVSGWICGDAVGKKSVDFMTSRIGINWDSPEIEHPVKGVVAYSPNHETSISFDGEGYILNRKLLPQKQLKDVLKLGVEMKYNVALRNLLIVMPPRSQLKLQEPYGFLFPSLFVVPRKLQGPTIQGTLSLCRVLQDL